VDLLCLPSRSRRGSALLAAAALLAAGCGPMSLARDLKRTMKEQEPRIAALMTYDVKLEVGGETRRYTAHLPPSGGGGPLPLVIALHGGFGNPYAIELESGLAAVADRGGFAVAYPEGLGKGGVGRSWNGGTCCGPPWERKVDDVAFIAAVIDDLGKRVPIDAGRVYATGHSNGAIMSYRLACDLSERIAAIAPVGGPDATATCAPKRPVSVIHFHGTADPCSPFKGGPGGGCAAKAMGLRPKPIFDTPSIPDIVAAWTRRIGAPAEGRVTLKTGAVTCTTWGPGREGTEAVLCTAEGGGHSWPGGFGNVPASIVGEVNRDVSASDLMWEFFRRHGRR